MSDMSVTPRDQRLLEQKQVEETKRESEQRLHNLRADYARREDEVRGSGDAAINHLKRATNERIDAAREDSQARLARETDTINKSYGDLRRRNNQQIAAMDQQITQAEENRDRSITQIKSNEEATIQRSQDQLKDFLTKQSERRAREEAALGNELRSAKEKAGAGVQKAKAEGNAELAKVQKKSREERVELQEQSRKNLEETRDQAARRIVELRARNQGQYQKEQGENSEAIDRMRDEYRETKEAVVRGNDRELRNLQREGQEDIRHNRDEVVRVNEKMLREYSKETQRIESQGVKTVAEKQEKFKKLKAKQSDENNAQIKELETDLLKREEKVKSEHEARLQENDEKTRGALQNQNRNFKRAFASNEKMYKDSLDNQKQNYLKTLYKQSTRFDKTIADDAARSRDPFYSVKTFDAKISERKDGYFVDAKVAPYDRETVEVKVQPDRISVSGRRSYENTLEDGNERAQTNSYQTYRQDFKLDVPVLADQAVTTIEKDGTISVFAPKKGFSPKKV